MNPDCQHASAILRNREPIVEVLRSILPASGLVLEVASGTGEHAVYFAQALPRLYWQPSDPSPRALRSIRAWRATENLRNLAAPLALDVVCHLGLSAKPPRWSASTCCTSARGQLLPA